MPPIARRRRNGCATFAGASGPGPAPAAGQTAAAVASRVFFHLEEPAQALRLALEAGERHFDIVNDKSAYVETLIAAAVEAYIEQKFAEIPRVRAVTVSNVHP